MDNIVKNDCLYLNKEFSDVEFVLKDQAGECVEIPANRAILASRSAVFGRMLYGHLKETGPVRITDVSAEAFTEFLKLFYLAKVQLAHEHIGEVLKLIDKYDASEFWPFCESFMEKTLAVSTAYEYYELALSFNLSDNFKTMAETVLCKNRKLVLYTNGEARTNVLLLSNILKSDKLVGNEVDIFNDLIAWAEALLQQRNEANSIENIRTELVGLLEHIRFPVMTHDELLKCLKTYPNLLPPDQMLDLISYVGNNDRTVQLKFNCKRRQPHKIVIEFELIKPLVPHTCSRMSLSLQWSGQANITYWVSLKVFMSTVPVDVYVNNERVHTKLLKSLRVDDSGFRIAILNEPIVLMKNEKVNIRIVFYGSVSTRLWYGKPKLHGGFENLKIETSEKSLISEVHLQEIHGNLGSQWTLFP